MSSIFFCLLHTHQELTYSALYPLSPLVLMADEKVEQTSLQLFAKGPNKVLAINEFDLLACFMIVGQVSKQAMHHDIEYLGAKHGVAWLLVQFPDVRIPF